MFDTTVSIMQPVRPFPRILATEIEENIIFHLRDDVKMLRICTQVCRAWHIASRPHLFTSTSIRVKDQKDLDKFCVFFEEEPYLASYVESVTIVPRYPSSKRGSPMKNGSDLIFIPLLRRLTSCRHLHLKGIGRVRNFSLRYHHTVLNTLKTTSQIVSLHLTEVVFPSKMYLLRFITALTHLRELYCVKVACSKNDSVGPGAAVNPYYRTGMGIRKLEVCGLCC